MIIKSSRKVKIKPEVKSLNKETPKKVEEQPKYKVVEEKPVVVETISEEEIKIEENLFDED
jgi:hypothetical protein